ncbi:MAG: class I SAM-dependent methyltransferase [Candidatus Eremiobacteraeota bacterium]|nr:class I SAM-dependent methyltransferase [Candidatus Eremiobacteraeota bacterium]MBC5823938.1 class I SAM-dependent methyltransferase [Candidatus Eremiobacteraeota bacterium]
MIQPLQLLADGDMRAKGRYDDDRCFACLSPEIFRICGIVDHHAGTRRRYTLWVCNACGSAHLGERLSSEQLEQIYPPTFYSYGVDRRRKRWVSAIERFRYYRHRFRPQCTRLLEIGSGCGEFLRTLDHVPCVIGLERASAASEAARKLGIDVRVGDVVDQTLFEPRSFDFAYLSHSFEHLDEPGAALESIHRWLTDNGELFIAVPNFAGLLPRLFRRHWYNLALPLHVSQFTPTGIRRLLKRHGFQVTNVRWNSDPLSIPMTAYFATGSMVTDMGRLVRVAMGILALLCIPLSRALDMLRLGDCIEIHAHKAGQRAEHGPYR